MHTLNVSVIDPEPDYDFERAKGYFARNIHRLPPLRWLMLPTPMRFNHPLLIEDPDFDIDFHVQWMYCPPPGGLKEFGALVSDLVRRPLERTRPLSEMYLVEGLEGAGWPRWSSCTTRWPRRCLGGVARRVLRQDARS